MKYSTSDEPSEQTQEEEEKEGSQGACGTAADEKPGKGKGSDTFEPTPTSHIWPSPDNAMNQSKFDAKVGNRRQPAVEKGALSKQVLVLSSHTIRWRTTGLLKLLFPSSG